MRDPNDYNSFTLDKGVERNFQWQLTGKIGNYETFFGARIDLWNDSSFLDTTKAVELTLTPTGPLIDGSEGSVIVAEIPLGDGDMLLDIPLGLYTLRAVLIGHDDSRTPIDVATMDNVESYTPEVAIEWESNHSGCGFGNDSGVKQMFILLDEENPKSLQSQMTGFWELVIKSQYGFSTVF